MPKVGPEASTPRNQKLEEIDGDAIVEIEDAMIFWNYIRPSSPSWIEHLPSNEDLSEIQAAPRREAPGGAFRLMAVDHLASNTRFAFSRMRA